MEEGFNDYLTKPVDGKLLKQMIKEAKYDIVLMDQRMPGMDGVEALHHIREMEEGKDIPVICLTADAIQGAKKHYMEEGFNDYLSKSVIYDDLEKILYKYIDSSKILTPEQIEAEEEKKNRPLVLVINSSSEKLNEIKELVGDRYKGVFVKNDEQARKFLARHNVEFIIRGNEE
jgi:CheY-like chemotaxis protein